MSKLAVIGGRDSILPFISLGMDIFPVETIEQASDFLKGIASEDYGAVFVQEEFAKELLDLIESLREKPLSVVIIPTGLESLGMGKESLRMDVRKAIGADILK